MPKDCSAATPCRSLGSKHSSACCLHGSCRKAPNRTSAIKEAITSQRVVGCSQQHPLLWIRGPRLRSGNLMKMRLISPQSSLASLSTAQSEVSHVEEVRTLHIAVSCRVSVAQRRDPTLSHQDARDSASTKPPWRAYVFPSCGSCE